MEFIETILVFKKIGTISDTNPNEYHCQVGDDKFTLTFGLSIALIGMQQGIVSRDNSIYDIDGQCILLVEMEDGEKHAISFGLVSYHINKGKQ